MQKENTISHLIFSGTVKDKSERTTNTGRKIVVLNLYAHQGYFLDCECWSTICDNIQIEDEVILGGSFFQDSWTKAEVKKYKFKLKVDMVRRTPGSLEAADNGGSPY
mgnify:CR=1 FL=1